MDQINLMAGSIVGMSLLLLLYTYVGYPLLLALLARVRRPRPHPHEPEAPSVTMGAPGTPVNAWYWRADEDGRGRHVVAEGLGTTRTVDLELVRGRGIWKEGRWQIVIARALQVSTQEPVAQLTPGETTGFGVAIWEGASSERAGLKSFSGDWRELRLAATPPATGR